MIEVTYPYLRPYPYPYPITYPYPVNLPKPPRPIRTGDEVFLEDRVSACVIRARVTRVFRHRGMWFVDTDAIEGMRSYLRRIDEVWLADPITKLGDLARA